ncbi:sulfotransferase 6B1-like [Rhinophrynus dorsalis]
MSGSEQKKTKQELFLEEMQRVVAEAHKKSPEELVVNYKGVLYPSTLCSEATFQALESFEAREDDLLAITYPKCGTNWLIKILHESLYALNDKEPSIEQAMIEFGKPEKVQKLKESPSPRVFSSHLLYDEVPKSFFEKKVKILLILRNPKDTAVSYFHFCNNNPVLPTYGLWDLFFKDYISGKVCYGSYFDHAVAWNKHIDEDNIMAVTFEDLKLDFPAQLKKISDFFGLALTEDQIKLVESKTTFQSMKENSKDTHGKFGNTFFRKGEIGDWKNIFTEEQSKEVDAKFEQYLAGTKLGEMLNYDKYLHGVKLDTTLNTHNSYTASSLSPENFKALESFESREDDMLLVSYPKCGTNWTFQLLNDIVRAVYNKEPSKMIPILEFGNPNKYEKLKEESSPRVLATHLYYDDIPKSFLDKKMLVVFRNPKDTAVSLFHFYNSNPTLPNYSSWDVFFQDFISGNVCAGSYFDHAVAWNKRIDDEDVLIITFEKMKEDLNAAVKEISEFFGFSLTEDQVKQIASKGTFESMKQNSKQTHGEIGKSIFRKGEVGDWKNHFSEAQSQEVDAKFEETLAGTKLGEMLKYNDYC